MDIPLFFILKQIKDCLSAKVSRTRSPAGSKMDLYWGMATWSLGAKAVQQKTQIPYQVVLRLWCHLERTEHPHLNSQRTKHTAAQSRGKEGKEMGEKRWSVTSSPSPMSCNEIFSTCPLVLCYVSFCRNIRKPGTCRLKISIKVWVSQSLFCWLLFISTVSAS